MAQVEIENQNGVKNEEKPRAAQAAAELLAVRPPGRKRPGFFGVLFRLISALILLLVAGGAAAIYFKDKDERLRVIADFIESAEKDPGAAASAASEQIERYVAQLLGQEPEKPASRVAGRKSTVAPTLVPLAQRPPAQPAPVGEAPTPAPAVPAQVAAPPPVQEVSREELAELREEIAALRQNFAAVSDAGQQALDTARAALEAAKQAQRPAPVKTEGQGDKPAGGAALAELSDSVTALEGRIDELGDEITRVRERLEQPKETTRADSETPVAAPAPKGEAANTSGVESLALAELLSEELRHGRPFAAETAALAERGADPRLLADLEPFAEQGAPTTAKLLAEFAPIARRLLALQGPAPAGESFWDGLSRALSKLVHVKSGAPDASSLDARLVEVEVALAHDDAAAAAQAFSRLPQDAESPAFGEKLNALARAHASSAALIEGAVAGLGHLKN